MNGWKLQSIRVDSTAAMAQHLGDIITRRPLVLDGAMGSIIQQADLSVDGDYFGRENCVDILVRSRPELIQSIH